jgi:HSP20 family protein
VGSGKSAKPRRNHLRERRYSRVARRFTLPDSVDDQKVDAKLSDGVLHLTLHKKAEVSPRKIEVK